MLDLVPAELEKHKTAADNLKSSVEAAVLSEMQELHSCKVCNRYGGSACTPLLEDARGTEKAAEHQAPGIPVVSQRACNLQVDSGGCKAVCWLQSLERSLTTSTDWSLQMPGTVLRHMDAAVAASASGTAASVAAVAVQLLPVARPVTAADRLGTQLSAAASAPVSVLSAFVAACPVPAPADGLSRGVVLACPLKTSELLAPDPTLLEALRI